MNGEDAMRIAHEVFADVPNDDEGEKYLEFVIWNWTGFPCFWAGDPETKFREQLTKYRDDPKACEAAEEAAYQEMKAMMDGDE